MENAMTSLAMKNTNAVRLANLAFEASSWNKKKHPSQYNTYDIPVDEPVGTPFPWFRDHSPTGYLRKKQQEYYGVKVSAFKIDPQKHKELVAEVVAEFGKIPTYMGKTVKYEEQV